MVKIKNIFPTNTDEINLIKFIARFQYLESTDAKYFFKGSYHSKRITKLVKNGILRRYKKNLTIGENGYHFLKILDIKKPQLTYIQSYIERLKNMSHIAAFFYKYKYITFVPSFELKDKVVFTQTARKYIGVLNIFGVRYLTYYISKNHSQRYINSVKYDIQKETEYKNIIIIVNDSIKINYMDFVFGLNSVIFCEDTEEQLQKLAYLPFINWSKVIKNEYDNQVHISEYNFCDYTNNKDKFISNFFLLDTEKIKRIDTFFNTTYYRYKFIIK